MANAKHRGSREVKPAEVNPFFRHHEGIFEGGDRTVTSPVDSVFNPGYVSRSGENVMERAIREELDGPSKRVVGGKGGR